MYTGLIEKRGILKTRIRKGNMHKITVSVENIWSDLILGESIAINGICVTITELGPDSFSADISIATLRDTNLDKLKIGTGVNLERCVSLGERLGGHIVQGHVDGVAKVISITRKEDNLIVKVETERALHQLITNKASIAIDGVSLTVQERNNHNFTLVIIPHSAKNTTLMHLKVGDIVNIEIDVLAKYVQHFMNN